MNNNNKKDTINKTILLNWLYSADKDLSIELLGKWITAKTEGRYVLLKKDNSDTTSLKETKI